ncbi:hypothetical protein [Lacticaseibacillus paracasei]
METTVIVALALTWFPPKATITVVSTKASIKAKDSTLVAGPDTKWNVTSCLGTEVPRTLHI